MGRLGITAGQARGPEGARSLNRIKWSDEMKLPWTKGEETKSVSSMMVALSQLGSARWGSRSSEALMRDGYLRNAVAYRCIRMVAEAAASVPMVSAQAATAALLARPMPDEAGPSLLETLYSQLQMTGNAYVCLLYTSPSPRDQRGSRMPSSA